VLKVGRLFASESCEELGITCAEWRTDRAPGNVSIVFVTPQSALTKRFLDYLEALRVTARLDRVVIDECHTILEGTPVFRPQLRELGRLTLIGVQMVYLTATLPPRREAELFALTNTRPEDVEMIRMRTTRKQRHKFGLEIKRNELERLLGSVQAVPNLAFHRTRMDATKTEALLANGEALANALRVEDYGRAVGALRAKIGQAMFVLAGREGKLKSRMDDQLEKLAAQKAEIVRQEENAKERLKTGLDRYQRSAKVAVTKAIREASLSRFDTDIEGDSTGMDENEVSVVFEDEWGARGVLQLRVGN
jgi:hypothetical protein